MNKLDFNFSLGEELMERLLGAYQRAQGIHHFRPETSAPQHLFIPKGVKRGSLKWRQWMARAAGTDYRTQSMYHYQSHAKLWEKHRPLYTYKAANYLPEVVGHILQAEGFSKWPSMSRQLPVLADTFVREFGDDPVNLYRFGSIEALMKFKKQFKRERGYEGIPCFGPKIASLYAIFLEEAGLIQIDDALPVDVWLQQIFLATRIIVTNEWVGAEVLEDKIRLFLCGLCARKGWSRIELAHALWFLGNRGCRVCHSSPHMELACVLWRNCQGKAVSDAYRLKGEWDPNAPRYRKGGDRNFALAPTPSDSPQQPLFPQEEK